MITGRDTLQEINDHILQAQSQIENADREMDNLNSRVSELRIEEADQFRQLAKFRLDEMSAGQVTARLDKVHHAVPAFLDQHKQALLERGAQAERKGIFGAPSFVTTDGELFWGDDRLEHSIEEFEGGRVPLGPHDGGIQVHQVGPAVGHLLRGRLDPLQRLEHGPDEIAREHEDPRADHGPDGDCDGGEQAQVATEPATT